METLLFREKDGDGVRLSLTSSGLSSEEDVRFDDLAAYQTAKQRKRQQRLRSILLIVLLSFSLLLFSTSALSSASPSRESLSLPTHLPGDADGLFAQSPSWDPILPSDAKDVIARSRKATCRSGLRAKLLGSSCRSDDIPNIVHFVFKAKRDTNGEQVAFDIPFSRFLSFYSAWQKLNPERIYFWTDFEQQRMDDAKKTGSEYTKAFFRIPALEIVPVAFPNETLRGVKFSYPAHQTDFVRARILTKMGGIYMDSDVYAIQDFAPLRSMGFDNVFGEELYGKICTGVWMSKPGNSYMQAFQRLQEKVYNGEWVTASTFLVTNLVSVMNKIGKGRSAVVLEQRAFFPGSWEANDAGQLMFYKLHPAQSDWREPGVPNSLDQIVHEFQNWNMDDWHYDWRQTYAIHLFGTSVFGLNKEQVFGEFGDLTPEYILSQRSNLGRAVAPILCHALTTDFLRLPGLSC